jgi:hypothetical protein
LTLSRFGIYFGYDAFEVAKSIPNRYFSMWKYVFTDEYGNKHRKLEKKGWERELAAALANLGRYLEALEQGSKPKQIQGGWIHPEPMDVLALDERGGRKKEGGGNKSKGLRLIRLYIYPDPRDCLLHVITVGTKETQSDDIAVCKTYVSALLGSVKDNDQSRQQQSN